MLSKNSECNELGLKCAEKDIPYYIAKHNFERTDFVKWLEECSSWINDKSNSSFDAIFEYWQKLVLIHRDEKYVSESDILLMKEDLLGVLQDSMEMKGNLKVWLKYIFWN